MKLLVFSDTHGSAQRMPAVVQQEEGADAILFLGDGSRDADKLEVAYPDIPLYRVAGNCDFGSFDPGEGLAAFGGVLFFYTHGHNYNVKGSLDTLLRTAKQRGADAALFGHTHAPHYECTEGVHLFNPGSLSIPRSGSGATYGVITIEDGHPLFEIKPFV